MIFTDSRYASGTIFKAQDARNDTHQVTVLRKFPSGKSTYYMYEWQEGDRLDELAYRLYGNSNIWWQIMDYNPEVSDALNIAPGTLLRVPIV